MVRRIILEILLFSVPFLVFYVYRAASKDLNIRDRWPLTTLVIIGGVLAVGALILTPLLEPSKAGLCDVSARYVNGERIEAKRIPCDEVGIELDPRGQGDGSRTPVAPRDLERER